MEKSWLESAVSKTVRMRSIATRFEMVDEIVRAMLASLTKLDGGN